MVFCIFSSIIFNVKLWFIFLNKTVLPSGYKKLILKLDNEGIGKHLSYKLSGCSTKVLNNISPGLPLNNILANAGLFILLLQQCT